MPGDRNARYRAVLETGAVFAFALAVALLMLGLLYRSTLYVSRTYNEGWNAAHAQALFDGRQLYHAPLALLTNNYPPLSFILTAALMHFVPDAVFAGRILATVAFLAIIVLIALVLLATTRDALAALFGGLIFAACMAANFPNYVGTDDPQMLAHAVLLGGLFVAVTIGPTRRGAALSAFIVTIGLFIKHNPIALPLALSIWFFLQNRRAFLVFMCVGLCCGVIGGAVCYAAFGPAFVTSLRAPRQYLIAKSWHDMISMPSAISALLGLGFLAPVLARGARFADFLGVYLAASIVIAGLATCGVGVSNNAFFEVVIAGALSAGYLVALAARDKERRYPFLRIWTICVLAFAAIFGPNLSATMNVMMLPQWMADQSQRSADTKRIVAFLTEHPGPALCETPVFCYWAGKEVEFDTFNFEQAIVTGSMTDIALVERINVGRYGAISLNAPESPDALTPAVMAAIHAHYRSVKIDTVQQVLYVRRDSPG